MFSNNAGHPEQAVRPEVTVYFPNWNVRSDSRNLVSNLPWDRLDCVNHAFWKIVPRGGGFVIVSTDSWADTAPDNPLAHFPLYAEYAGRYPDKKIMLSIGGWTCCGCFSEMALTKESRGSFIQSCLDTLDAYPFFSGLDIDWEYPGVARPGNSHDEGNPVMGDDRANYTLLLKELREALDRHDGLKRRTLTVCAGASVSTLARQDYASLHAYVDRINLMTYDLAGPWDHHTGHHTALFGDRSADTAVKYLMSQGVPADRIAIGSPLDGHGWKLHARTGNPVGAAADSVISSDLTWRRLRLLEQVAVPDGVPGWHSGYDNEAEAAWLWNDDPVSPDDLTFCTYENFSSLNAKLKYIRDHHLGGLIVWEIHGDSMDAGWPMITRMAKLRDTMLR